MPFSLNVTESINAGGGQLSDITFDVSNWSRSTSFEGGSWRGSFRLDGPKEMLEDWFYGGLGRHIEEWSWGMNTWTGLVWEIDYVQPSRMTYFAPTWEGERPPMPGRRMRRTLEDVFNEVKVLYTDPSTSPPTVGETSWYSDATSKYWWGDKQEILHEYMSATTAVERAQEFLARAATSVPQMIGVEQDVTDSYVEVVVVGYVATGQYEFVVTDNGNQDDVSDWIDAILGAAIGNFLTKGIVDSNTTQIYRYLSNKRKAWEVLEDLATLRNPSGDRYSLIIHNNRQVDYKKWDREPIGYFWGGKFVDLAYTDLEINPRIMRPGIYRALGFTDPEMPYLASGDTLLLSPHDLLVESVEVAQDDTFTIRLGVYDEEESLRSFVFRREDLPWYQAPDTSPPPPDEPDRPPFNNPYYP